MFSLGRVELPDGMDWDLFKTVAAHNSHSLTLNELR
jgi:hypothetical protein